MKMKNINKKVSPCNYPAYTPEELQDGSDTTINVMKMAKIIDDGSKEAQRLLELDLSPERAVKQFTDLLTYLNGKPPQAKQ